MGLVTNLPPDRTLSQLLASYLCHARIEDLDQTVRRRAKEVIAYHISIAFRTLHERLAEGEQVLAAARLFSDGCGGATLIGQSDKVTMADAAMANCTLMRATGLDDVIFPVGVHAGLMTLPIALAIGEHEKSSGAELLISIVLGYEIMGKFGSWTWSEEYPRRPYMAYGPFGGIAVAGRLLRLDPERMAVALAFAAHTAMGLAESDRGQVTHHYALVCRNSLTGAYLAAGGAYGSMTVLEGRFGFLDIFSPNARIDASKMMASFGRDHVIVEALEKRYPGTAANQVPIEAMRDMVTKGLVKADNIDSIIVSVPIERKNIAVINSIGPFDDSHTTPSSFAFQMAMLIIDGDLHFHRYAEIDNPEIMAVVRRIRVEFVEGRPIRYAKVEVVTKNGKVHMREGTHFAFPAQDPFTIIAKYAAPFLPKDRIQRFVDLLDRLETLPDVSEMIACLAP
jgi:2-methylcitrate dehydratase PrpD